MKSLLLSTLTASLLAKLISSNEDPLQDKDQCKDGELYKTETYRYDDENTWVKINTEFNCKCDRKYEEPNLSDYGHLYHHYPFLNKIPILCPEENQDPLDVCDHQSECQYDTWNDIGEESPGVLYKDYSEKKCDCYDKSCKIEYVEKFRTTYTCKHVYEKPQNNTCSENAVFRVEYWRETNRISNSGGKDLGKYNTGFLCKCDSYRNNVIPILSKDPIGENEWTKDFQCPPQNYREKLKSCKTKQVCKTDYYNDKGYENPGELYTDYSLPRCRCKRYQKCINLLETNSTITTKNYSCVHILEAPENPCKEGDIHKEEIWRNLTTISGVSQYFKQATTFLCKCNVDRHHITNSTKRDPKRKDINITSYKCFEAPQISNTTCYEHQICRREFKYFLGKDHPNEMYIDTVEEYCHCTDGRDCQSFGSLPSQMFPEYDAVVSYRCMSKEPTMLVPCDPNQVFSEEIWRAEEIRKGIAFHQAKLHTYIKCICETEPIQNPTVPDPNERRQWVLTKTCPWFLNSSRPYEKIKCKDYAVCRVGFMTNVGVEEVDSYVVERYNTTCTCEVDRLERFCDKVGERNRKLEIYRCVKKDKHRIEELEDCKSHDLHRIDIYKYIFRNGSMQILNRTNTFQLCHCFARREKILPDDKIKYGKTLGNEVITKVLCVEDPYPIKEIPYCKFEEECEIHDIVVSGTERTHRYFEEKSQRFCNCTFPRSCQESNKDKIRPDELRYRCIFSNKTKSRLSFCKPGELYLKEIKTYVSHNNREVPLYRPRNTILMCICEQVLYNGEIEEKEKTLTDPEQKLDLIEFHLCPKRKYSKAVVDSCKDYSICRKELYKPFGYDVGINATYLKNNFTYCECDGDRICNKTGDVSGGTITYRCISEAQANYSNDPCTKDQDFMVEIYENFTNDTPDKKDVYLNCHCDYDPHILEIGNVTTGQDHEFPFQWMTTHKCPLGQEEDELSPCGEYDVCMHQHFDTYGRERPGEFLFKPQKKCLCSRPNICSRTGKEDTYYSFQCIPKEERYCDSYEIHKVVYFDLDSNNAVKNKNVVNNCVCERKYKEDEDFEHNYHHNESLNLFFKLSWCAKSKIDYIEPCLPDAECQYDYLNEDGNYRGSVSTLCACDGYRRCVIDTEEKLDTEEKSRTIYKCKIEYTYPPNDIDCKEGDVFKVEILKKMKPSDNEEDLIKLNTFFMCRCLSYDGKKNTTSILRKDFKQPKKWIKSYRCPESSPVEDPLLPCITSKESQRDYLSDYGLERQGETYVDYRIHKCRCNRFRKLFIKERSKVFISHTCELENTTDFENLPQCNKTDFFKEVYVKVKAFMYTEQPYNYRMDTRLLCRCEPQRKELTFENFMIFNKLNTSVYVEDDQHIDKYYCPKANDSEQTKTESLPICYEQQLCKKYYMKNYGDDRDTEKYIDVFGEYCRCTDGQCKEVADVPYRHGLDIFDHEVSFRCFRQEGLKMCSTPDMTYMITVHRRIIHSNSSFQLNSYKKCICDTYQGELGGMEEVEDPSDSYLFLRTYKCIGRANFTRKSCEDYAVCISGRNVSAGREDKHAYDILWNETYCNCHGSTQNCLKVGGEGNEVVSRCIPRTQYQEYPQPRAEYIPICREFQDFKFEINQTVPLGDSFVQLRLNTFQECKCFSDVVRWKPIRDGYFHNQIIFEYKCYRPEAALRSTKLSYCSKMELCDLHDLKEAGLESPSAKIFSHSVHLCVCTPPRTSEIDLRLSSVKQAFYRCTLSSNTEVKLNICAPGQLFKDVVYFTENEETIEGQHATKRNTILMCICEAFFYKGKEGVTTSVKQDFNDATLQIESYFCPKHPYIKEELPSCMDYAICFKEVYTEYGSDIEDNLKYLRNNISYCDCNSERACILTGSDYPETVEREESTVNMYRCLPKDKRPDMPCDKDRVEVYLIHIFRKQNTSSSESEVKMNSFSKCICYAYTNESLTINVTSIQDPTNPIERIERHTCTHGTSNKVYCTEEDQVCIEDHYEDYGRERPGKHMYKSDMKCICSLTKLCSAAQVDGNDTKYRCKTIQNRYENFTKVDEQLPKCKEHEMYLEEYSYGNETLNSIRKCICPGDGFTSMRLAVEYLPNSSVRESHIACIKSEKRNKMTCIPPSERGSDICRSDYVKRYGYGHDAFYRDLIETKCNCVFKTIFNVTCSEIPWDIKELPKEVYYLCNQPICKRGDTCGATVFDSEKNYKRRESFCECHDSGCLDFGRCRNIYGEIYRYRLCASRGRNFNGTTKCPGIKDWRIDPYANRPHS